MVPFADLCITNYPSIVVELLLYAPPRAIVDSSVVFLWFMTVGTVACAAVWSEFTANKQSAENREEFSPKVTYMLSWIHLEFHSSLFCLLLLQQSFFFFWKAAVLELVIDILWNFMETGFSQYNKH